MNTISRSELSTILDRLASEAKLIAPTDVEGVILYKPVATSDQIAWDFTRPVLPIKDAFFPATERLLTIEKIGQEITISEYLSETARVIFGVRPCDARGVKTLETLFIDTPPIDPYFAHRRANTTLIGLSCQEMGETCFCTSMGGSPDDPQDMDIMLTQAEDGYSVQIITKKGQALLADRLSQDRGSRLSPQITPSRNPISVPALEKIDWPGHFHEAYWDRIAERCLSCRLCAYICPTCRCFTVRDAAVPGDNGNQVYERIRCWDACTGEAYRKIAGGHNPRQAKGQRLRNRIYCKFDYYPKQYGPMACTGCGRCVEMCPVNIDITEILRDLTEVTA